MRFNQLRVLVVDDSPTMLTIVAAMLSVLGLTSVEKATSGEEALAKIRAGHFSIILSDWDMAPLNGIELLRMVRPLQTPKLNRFIFMTAANTWGHQTTARIDGADDFLAKPFSADKLKASIAKIAARM